MAFAAAHGLLLFVGWEWADRRLRSVLRVETEERFPMTRYGFFLGLAALLVTPQLVALEQETITIQFENRFDENGVTPQGTRDFSFRGSNWSGGVVETEGILALYASGRFSYEVDTDLAQVTFDTPVDSVTFFYVHGFTFAAGTATAYGADGSILATAASNDATTPGDKFVTFDVAVDIARVEFTAGVIDDFSFTRDIPVRLPILESDIAFDLEEIAAGLTSPLMLTHAGDDSGRLFVVDQVGTIRIIKNGQLLEEPFLDLDGTVVEVNPGFDERGLLGVAFHPDYATNGRFFVRYSAPRAGDPAEPCNDPDGFIVGCHKEVLSEFAVSSEDPDRADPTERVLFEVDEPEFNHDGGHVAFGPDGFLYFSLGDGGGRDDGLSSNPPTHGETGHGQNINTALGSVLRIDVDNGDPFAIPEGNPFVDEDGLDEIYAYGFRNPYRFSFDSGGTNELIVADVGQNLFEEVNIVTNGGNYGWVLREGANCFDPANPSNPPDVCQEEGLIDPISEYDHLEGLAVIGGHVYRGSALPALAGHYVFGDFSTSFGEPLGRLFAIDMDGDNRAQIFELLIGEARAPLGEFLFGFGEDAAGEIYVLTSANAGPVGNTGRVFKIVPIGSGDGLQVPGDCNQDGTVDVSDAVCLFGVLFVGTPPAFPCGDGSPDDPGNIGLIDWQPDGLVDISDGISALNFLFVSGFPAHTLAVPGMEVSGCVPIAGCDDNPSCL